MKIAILEEGAINRGDIDFSPISSLGDTVSYPNTTESDKKEHLKGGEIILTNKVAIDEEVFREFPQIKYVGVLATGYNVVDIGAARKRGIPVTNVPDYCTESAVQHTWALILELFSKVGMHSRSVAEGDWTRSETFCYWLEPGVELAGRTIGIYGFGNIGRGVARVAQAFGMNVLVHTTHPEKYRKEYCGYSFVDKETVFSSADVLSLHCPLDGETAKLVSAKTISLMKDGAVLVNVSRGGLVDEDALARALRQGKLAGAALDVIGKEPMEANCPLMGCPNTIITPHMAWAGISARKKLVREAALNIESFLRGGRRNCVY